MIFKRTNLKEVSGVRINYDDVKERLSNDYHSINNNSYLFNNSKVDFNPKKVGGHMD